MEKNKGFIFIITSIFISMLFLGDGCKKEHKRHEFKDNNSLTVSNQLNQEKKGKVLVIHSYNYDYEWVVGVNRGIKIGIADFDIQVEHFYMDTKNRTSNEWKKTAADTAMNLIDQWKPDVVITVDDNAQQYVGSKIAKTGRPNLVFCGVNNQMELYGYPTENVTGILERPHFKECMQFLKNILPNTKNVVIISDVGPTTDGTFEYMQKQDTGDINVLGWHKLSTLDQWKNAVMDAQRKADAIVIYTYHTLKTNENDEKSVPSKTVIGWTVQNSQLPIVGFLTFAIDNGTFCGVIESAMDQGFLAGQKTVKILNGQKPGSIEVSISKKTQKMINLDTAKKLGIDVNEKILSETDILVGN